MRIFPTAQESKQISQLAVVHTEVRTIESSVLTAREKGLRVALVNNTPVTNSKDYFLVWKKQQTNTNYTEIMDQIITYFQTLGYVILRKTNQNTSNTFDWEISW